MSYDGGCGDSDCELCKEDHRLSMEHAKLLERLCTPGTDPPEWDIPRVTLIDNECPRCGQGDHPHQTCHEANMTDEEIKEAMASEEFIKAGEAEDGK